MRGRRRISAASHFILALLAVVTLAIAGMPATPVPAFAQERVRPWWSLRELFMPRNPRRANPRNETPPGVTAKPPRAKAPAARKPAPPRAVQQPEAVVSPKAPDAKTVLVLGDFIAGGLAEGLNVAFADDPNVRIADRSSGSSGFVREDHFDWPGQVTGIIEAEKPAAILVLIGANDRQPMRIGDTSAALRSEAWTREYSARVASFASAASATNVPLVWVGATPFKPSKAASDMLALNEIYRKVAADVGAEFIDVWDGFVDENGAFVTTGPDISGQPVRLRAGDGINLTDAGKRKLAYYTEKTLKRLLGIGAAPSGPGGIPSVSAEPGGTVPLDRTIPMALDDPALDGGANLLGASLASASAAPSAGVKPGAENAAPAVVSGRADDFSWPPKSDTARSTTSAVPQGTAAAVPAGKPATGLAN
ncbi:SGNH/GDSL hydrolase family protein [Mesorhizobium sp. CN2-181]|uniref:SGNH/GDSL hydrolase family protein n=1 Tax=Mesorhizobium yinganensis TaxID=3157707 RepID=UPI0032B8305D